MRTTAAQQHFFSSQEIETRRHARSDSTQLFCTYNGSERDLLAAALHLQWTQCSVGHPLCRSSLELDYLSSHSERGTQLRSRCAAAALWVAGSASSRQQKQNYGEDQDDGEEGQFAGGATARRRAPLGRSRGAHSGWKALAAAAEPRSQASGPREPQCRSGGAQSSPAPWCGGSQVSRAPGRASAGRQATRRPENATASVDSRILCVLWPCREIRKYQMQGKVRPFNGNQGEGRHAHEWAGTWRHHLRTTFSG